MQNSTTRALHQCLQLCAVDRLFLAEHKKLVDGRHACDDRRQERFCGGHAVSAGRRITEELISTRVTDLPTNTCYPQIFCFCFPRLCVLLRSLLTCSTSRTSSHTSEPRSSSVTRKQRGTAWGTRSARRRHVPERSDFKGQPRLHSTTLVRMRVPTTGEQHEVIDLTTPTVQSSAVHETAAPGRTGHSTARLPRHQAQNGNIHTSTKSIG